MGLRIQCLSIDTADPARLADFWQDCTSTCAPSTRGPR